MPAVKAAGCRASPRARQASRSVSLSPFPERAGEGGGVGIVQRRCDLGQGQAVFQQQLAGDFESGFLAKLVHPG